jgi:hypothetical protein
MAHHRFAAPSGELLRHSPPCAQALAGGDDDCGEGSQRGHGARRYALAPDGAIHYALLKF